jgi:ABC-type uncharacterized transport system permease subunit
VLVVTGISFVCFGASYAVTLALEVSRLFFRLPVRFVVMVLFAAAGLVAQSLYLAMRAQQGLPGGLPLSSWSDWCLLASWVLVAIYLYLAVRRPESAMGIFLLPLVLALVAVAYFLKDGPTFQRAEAREYWGMLHGISLMLGTVAVILGFVAGLMYLVQSYRLKQKLPPRLGFKLPSLEWLQRFNERSLVISSLLLLAGIAAGTVFNIVKQNEAVPWTDRTVLISGVLVLWLIAALLFNGVYRPARQGRKVAYLTVASFVVLMLVLGIVFSSSQHANAVTSRGTRAVLLPGVVASAHRGAR